MHVGRELARARQQLGRSLEDISAKTKVSVERLIAIEQNDVNQLPPLVYVRGFVRSYATEVGLDPDDTVGRYLAQFDTFTPPGSASEIIQGAHDSDQPPLVTSSEYLVQPPDPRPERDSVSASAAEQEAAAGTTAGPLWRRAEFLPGSLRGHTLDEAHARAADHEALPTPPQMPAAGDDNWRDAVYEDWRRAVEASATKPPATKSSRRTPLAPLLVLAAIAIGLGVFASTNWDRFSGASPGDDREATSAPSQKDMGDPDGDAAPAASAGDAAVNAEKPATAADSEPRDAHDSTRADGAAVENLSGRWLLTNRVESSAYKPFNNLSLAYRLDLRQDGNRVTGTGQKWTENGRTITAKSRTPISVAGTLNGRRLELKFTERGTRRATGGVLRLDVSEDGLLRGKFESAAARSSGSSQAQRVP
jgi:transcriptional regulator with XRE-family HTH domain